jgi:2-amino-4-hydroxy-6-hydroxymethyldihydropteridine diphosphokinase
MTHGKQALLAFGGNLPLGESGPETTILASIRALGDEGLPPVRVSRLYRTPCFPAGAGPDYVNAAAVVTWRNVIDPAALLAVIHRIEAAFGRERLQRWGMRTLDIDLIAVGDSVLPDPATWQMWKDLPQMDQARRAPDRLILPHPRLQDRAFVLVPLTDVAPDWRHPVLGRTIREMCDALPPEALAEVVPLDSAATL